MQIPKSVAALLGSTALLAVGGCDAFKVANAGADVDPPEVWTAGKPGGGSVLATGWLSDFGGSEGATLRKHVNDALEGNRNLRAVAARLQAARARAVISGAARYPEFDIRSDASRNQRLAGERSVSVRDNRFELALDMRWEVDLWGRVRDEKQAALFETEAAAGDYDAARLSLAANIAKSSVRLVEAEKLQALARETHDVFSKTADLIDSEFDAGVNDRKALDVALNRATERNALANLKARDRDADLARRTLEVLLGEYPAGKLESLGDFPTMKRNVPAGLPSELLLRRPDLIAAEARARASSKKLAAAKKQILPGFLITGSAGRGSTEFEDLIDPKSLLWGIAAGLAQPVTRGGAIRAGIELSEAEREEIAANYSDAALEAFREVESALASEIFLNDQVNYLREAEKQYQIAEEQARSDYEAGAGEIVALLETQRRLFESRSAAIQASSARIQNRIDLHLALGGDFDTPPGK